MEKTEELRKNNMITFEETLKDYVDIRLSCGDKWLVWDKECLQWIVYQRKMYQKKTRILIQTKYFEFAIPELIEG